MLHTHNFLFGPQIGYRSGKIRPFAHALFGISAGSLNAEGPGVPKVEVWSDNAFAMALGGGLDYKVNRLLSIRLGQFDYLRTQFDLTLFEPGNDAQNHFRYQTGVVLNFGGK